MLRQIKLNLILAVPCFFFSASVRPCCFVMFAVCGVWPGGELNFFKQPMLPIGDDNSSIRSAPVVTYLLIFLNVIVFLFELLQGAQLQAFINRWGAVPELVLDGKRPETLLTSMFLHGGWMHIIGNMLFLKVFGDNVEDRLGRGRFVLLYLLTGLAAHAAHFAFNAGSGIPTVGASGAISGVLGAYIVMFGRNRVNVLIGFFVITLPAWAMIGFWALQQFLATFATISATQETGGVAYAAHAGGFVAGIILAFLLGGGGGQRQRQPWRPRGAGW